MTLWNGTDEIVTFRFPSSLDGPKLIDDAQSKKGGRGVTIPSAEYQNDSRMEKQTQG
jgi:hypothetical protein